MPGYILLSSDFIVSSCTVPRGTLSPGVISGALGCVGPTMKFPSASGGGTWPSGSSFAWTYPGVCGSRAGGVGRGGRAAVAGALAGADCWDCAETTTGCADAVNPRTNASVRRDVFMGFNGEYARPDAGV